ncbi:helix-turn-helix domain-containing protein [Actinopolymorpha sp. NPDC004070]|uniref:helix-turn-helix domain-containing protein n=1 Tax=Actinopolymorpha sp. NPDC004070 TaxID=3154548 RepID=UPI0033B1274E
MSTTYTEVPAPAALAGDVRCLWRSSFGGTSPILPDGCLDIVVAPGEVIVAGPDTGPWESPYDLGAPVHGLRFEIGRAARVLGVPAEELRDQRVGLADLWGAAGARAAARLVEDPGHLTEIVARRLGGSGIREADREVDHVVRVLGAGGRRVHDALAGRPLGERQFRRRFSAAVGYGPAMFARVARLVRVRDLARLHPGATLADLAATAGYTDQAHLARDCRGLAGATPSALLRPGPTWIRTPSPARARGPDPRRNPGLDLGSGRTSVSYKAGVGAER